MLILSTDYANYLEEIQGLFSDFKHNTGTNTLDEFIKSFQGHFWTATFNDKFAGCVYLDRWNLEKKQVYLGGFSPRKNPFTLQGVELICKHTFKNYPVERINILIFNNSKTERLFLKKMGFKLIDINKDEFTYSIERI